MNSVHSQKETERTAEDISSKNKRKCIALGIGGGTFAALMLIGIVAAAIGGAGGGGGVWCYHQGPCAPSEVTGKKIGATFSSDESGIVSVSRLRRLADKDVAVEVEMEIIAAQQVIEGIHTIKAQPESGDESLYCVMPWRGGDPVAPPTMADVVAFLKVKQPNEVIYGVGDSTVRHQVRPLIELPRKIPSSSLFMTQFVICSHLICSRPLRIYSIFPCAILSDLRLWV